MRRNTFGSFFKELRIKRGMTLRYFCQRYGLDPGNMSKLERGLLAPPHSDEKLTEYATMLKIRKGTDDWYAFFDTAAAGRGKVPSDVMEDKELVGKLPVLFRTLRGQKVSKRNLDKLIEKIRTS